MGRGLLLLHQSQVQLTNVIGIRLPSKEVVLLDQRFLLVVAHLFKIALRRRLHQAELIVLFSYGVLIGNVVLCLLIASNRRSDAKASTDDTKRD